MNTFLCKTCGQQHEVYDLQDIKGKHRLTYICHGVKTQSTDKAGNIILKAYTKELPYDGPELDGPFRVVWTSRLAKQKVGEKQLQLIIRR